MNSSFFSTSKGLLLGALLLTSCAKAQPAIDPAVLADLAPTGKLRSAFNLGNGVLAIRDPVTGEPSGLSADLSRELARRLGVEVEFIEYTSAGSVMSTGLQSGAWDIAYVAIDPGRAQDVDFTAPHVLIEGVYLVREDSPLRSSTEVDQAGNRVVVGTGSAYDLFLTRALQHATIVRIPRSPDVVDQMLAEGYEVSAGVKQQLVADARRVPGVRLLEGRFMEIPQAMAIPKGREAGALYLRAFLEEMKASGFVANALQRYGIEDALVAPAEPASAP